MTTSGCAKLPSCAVGPRPGRALACGAKYTYGDIQNMRWSGEGAYLRRAWLIRSRACPTPGKIRRSQRGTEKSR